MRPVTTHTLISLCAILAMALGVCFPVLSAMSAQAFAGVVPLAAAASAETSGESDATTLFGDKVLICTGQGYEWISAQEMSAYLQGAANGDSDAPMTMLLAKCPHCTLHTMAPPEMSGAACALAAATAKELIVPSLCDVVQSAYRAPFLAQILGRAPPLFS